MPCLVDVCGSDRFGGSIVANENVYSSAKHRPDVFVAFYAKVERERIGCYYIVAILNFLNRLNKTARKEIFS
jgi:hypothetical protein